MLTLWFFVEVGLAGLLSFILFLLLSKALAELTKSRDGGLFFATHKLVRGSLPLTRRLLLL